MGSLSGQRIVVTRASHQAEELADPLRNLGAEVILLPAIGIGPPDDPEPLRQAALRAGEYDWIIFTSQNSLDAFAAQRPKVQNSGVRVAAVGRSTAAAAETAGFHVDLVPERYVAESLLESFSAIDLNSKRVLIPSAAVTRDLIPPELRKRGAIVTVVEAYRNVLPQETLTRAPEVFREPLPDWVLFASPSAIDNLVSLISAELLRHIKIATIGPVTSQAVAKLGIAVTAEARIQSVEGLVDAVAAFTES